MNVSNDELKGLIEAGEESRHIEYKGSQPWDDLSFRETIIRTILAMANIRDGGSIVIGLEEQSNGSYLPKGVENEHLQTYNEEQMKDQVGEYADPYVDFSVREQEYDGKKFIIITVREFQEIPVICKKDANNLQKGAIYVRTRVRRPESARVSNHSDMREIIELAVDKGMRRLRERGYILEEREPTARELFDAQLEGL